MEKASVLYLSMHTLTETSLQLDLPRNIKQSIFALLPNTVNISLFTPFYYCFGWEETHISVEN